MENTFLPAGYEKPAGNSRYFRLQEGNNRFRILSPAITGFEDWKETRDGNKITKSPIRTKDKPTTLFNPVTPAKHFWAFVVYDYKEKAIKIMEITQSTIQTAIFDLHSDNNWGDPKGYDLNIKRTGKDKESKYTVMPAPPTPLAKEISDLYIATPIDLEALYRNADPFQSSEQQPQGDYPQQGHTEDNFPEEDIDVDNIPFSEPYVPY